MFCPKLFLPLRAFVLIFALSAVPAFAFAGPATDVVRDKQSALFQLLQADKPDQAKIGAIFDEMLDYDTLAKTSLADAWSGLSETQRKEFTGLLKQLVQRSYERNLKKTLNFLIEYTGEEAAGDGFLVKTKATHKTDKREAPIAIHFKLGQDKTSKKFKVVDIITEDVSLVESYRSQFSKVIKKDGFDVLLKKMKEKIAKGE